MYKALVNACLVEAKERAGWYALGSGIFTLFLREKYKLTRGQAGLVFQAFYACMYMFTLLGGYLGDKFGRRKMIGAGLLLTAAGYFMLPFNLVTGMLLVIAGNAAFKPNMTTSVNSICRAEGYSEEQTDASYSWFYLAINIGGFVGPAISSIFEERKEYGLVFATAYIPLLLAFAWFVVVRKDFPDSSDTIFEEVSEELQRLRNKCLNIICWIAPAFWCAFHAGPTQLTFFSADFTDRKIGNFVVPSGWPSASNSLYILIFTPALIYIFKKLEKMGRAVPIATKLMLGFILTGAAFAIMVMASVEYRDVLAPLFYIAFCWLVLTISELFISPMGNSLFAQYAPNNEKGKWMGKWFISISVGNIAGGLWGYFGEHLPKWIQFSLFATLPLFSAVVMWVMRHDMNKAFRRVDNLAEDTLIPPGKGAILPLKLAIQGEG